MFLICVFDISQQYCPLYLLSHYSHAHILGYWNLPILSILSWCFLSSKLLSAKTQEDPWLKKAFEMIIVLATFIHQGKLAPLILRHTQYFWRYMIRIVFKYQFLLRCPSWATYNPFLEHQHVMYTCTSANSIFVGTELSAYCKHGATLSHSIISIQLLLNDMHCIAQSIADVSFLWHGPFVCPSKRNWTRTRAVLDIPILSHSFTFYSYLCKDHPNSFFSSPLHFTTSFQPTLRSHFLFTLHHLTLHTSVLSHHVSTLVICHGNSLVQQMHSLIFLHDFYSIYHTR